MSSRSVESLERRTFLSAAPGVELDVNGNVALPRGLSEAERVWLEEHTGEAVASVGTPTAPPTGPIDPVAEYEPMEGIVVSWMSFTSNLTEMTKRITVEGNSRVYIGVTSASVQTSATNLLNGAGANMSNVTFFTVPLNSVWARDYGPRYVYEGGVRVITDHEYNRLPQRASDDVQPLFFANMKKQEHYKIGIGNTMLVHGGGNYHLDANGDAYATTLITDENPNFTGPQVQQIWDTYQNNSVTITDAFPTSIDATQHIDMWMQIYDDNKVFISDWPSAQGSVQDQICETTASLMASRGYQVTRLPAYSIGGVHYTYTNMVIVNNVVLLPNYTNGPGATVSNQAFAQVQAAFGAGKQVFQINANQIIQSAGAFHCIVQHIPKHLGLPGANGGLAPTAYVRELSSSTFVGGQQVAIKWLTDDDAPKNIEGGVSGVDLLLSTNGGQSFNTTIASNQPALGTFNWTVPLGLDTSAAKIRVVARDGLNNTGFDDTNQFAITLAASNTPTTPDLDAVSDSGVLDTDGITKLNNVGDRNKLVFNVGGTVAGSIVRIYIDDIIIGVATATTGATIVETDAVTPILDGTHTISARQTEPGKAESVASLQLSITVDTIAPAVSSPAFLFETLPHAITYAFNENVAPTLAGADLSLADLLATASQTADGVSYAAAINTATFTFSAALADSRFRATLSGVSDIAGNDLATDGAFAFHFLRGDATGDAAVNINDFSILAARFNTPGTFSQGDFNYNGQTEIGDFSILASRFNTALASARSAPGNLILGRGWTPMNADLFSRRNVDLLESGEPAII